MSDFFIGLKFLTTRLRSLPRKKRGVLVGQQINPKRCLGFFVFGIQDGLNLSSRLGFPF